MLGVSTNYATPNHPQTNGQVKRFNKTLVQQLRNYVSELVVTWARYVSLLVTAYDSQVHSGTGEAPFSFVCPRKRSLVAKERLTQGTGDEAPSSTPRQASESLRKRLDEMIFLVQKSMDKAQARYKRHFDKRFKSRREALRVGDCVLIKSHENQGGKLIFRTKGPYQILKTDGRRLTIKSTDGIRTINGNHATLAPEPPEGDPAWERALQAWRVPAERQQNLVQASTTSHESSLAKGPGYTPADTKHAHAPQHDPHRPEAPCLSPDDDGPQTSSSNRTVHLGPRRYDHNQACSQLGCSAEEATQIDA